MAQIAYILLCHKNVASIVSQAQQLTALGDVMAIHFDARASKADYEHLRAELADNPNVVFPRRRLKCGWGEWSLVDATLVALQAAADAFPRATHFYMLSGDCMPIKTAEYVHDYLEQRDVDFIESEAMKVNIYPLLFAFLYAIFDWDNDCPNTASANVKGT